MYRILRSISGEAMTVLDRAVTQLHFFTESLALEEFYRISNQRGKIFMWFNRSFKNARAPITQISNVRACDCFTYR